MALNARVTLPMIGLVTVSSFAAPVLAEPVLASDPAGLVAFFFEKEYPAQLSKDSYGDPMIEFRVDGNRHVLLFFDCVNNTNCLSVQFNTVYAANTPVSLETLNEWNSGERRFMRAYYFGGDETVHMAMDVATSADGISAQDFADLVSLWVQREGEFKDFIGATEEQRLTGSQSRW